MLSLKLSDLRAATIRYQVAMALARCAPDVAKENVVAQSTRGPLRDGRRGGMGAGCSPTKVVAVALDRLTVAGLPGNGFSWGAI